MLYRFMSSSLDLPPFQQRRVWRPDRHIERAADGAAVDCADFRAMDVSDMDVADVISVMPSYSYISTLCLKRNAISGSGAACIADWLMKTSVLRYLSISGNPLGDCGVSALASALEVNTSLRWLNISKTHFGEQGCVALRTALSSNSTLEELKIRSCLLQDEHFEKIVSGLRNNVALESLVASMNLADMGVAQALNARIIRAFELLSFPRTDSVMVPATS